MTIAEDLACRNMDAPVVDVVHADLVRFSDDSMFKSECPVCNYGILLVGRDEKTFELLAEDRCVLCGQKVRYTDIEALRVKDRGRTPILPEQPEPDDPPLVIPTQMDYEGTN